MFFFFFFFFLGSKHHQYGTVQVHSTFVHTQVYTSRICEFRNHGCGGHRCEITQWKFLLPVSGTKIVLSRFEKI